MLAEAAGLDRGAVARVLGEAIRAGLVEELPDSALACRFTHELLRRAVYDGITGVERAELHLRVGETLERAYAAEPTRALPELAHHFTLAAPVAGVARAVDYNLRAADVAIAAAAFEEGAARLTTALELGIDDPRDRARTQIELAHLLHQMGRIGEADAMITASLEVATGLEERGIVANALVYRFGQRMGDPALDPYEMRKTTAAAVETLRQLGDSRGVALAGRYLALSFQYTGQADEARIILERALADADESGDRGTRRRVAGTLAHSLCLGPTPVVDAIGRCRELLESSRGDPVLTAVVARFLGLLLAMAGRFDEAREHLETSTSVLDELQHETSVWVYRWAAADAWELLGDHAGAERELRAMRQKFQGYGEQPIDERAVRAAYHLAFLYCDHGRWVDAADCVLYGRDSPLACPTAGAIYRRTVQARLAAHHGRVAEALALAERGVGCARVHGQPEPQSAGLAGVGRGAADGRPRRGSRRRRRRGDPALRGEGQRCRRFHGACERRGGGRHGVTPFA